MIINPTMMIQGSGSGEGDEEMIDFSRYSNGFIENDLSNNDIFNICDKEVLILSANTLSYENNGAFVTGWSSFISFNASWTADNSKTHYSTFFSFIFTNNVTDKGTPPMDNYYPKFIKLKLTSSIYNKIKAKYNSYRNISYNLTIKNCVLYY